MLRVFPAGCPSVCLSETSNFCCERITKLQIKLGLGLWCHAYENNLRGITWGLKVNRKIRKYVRLKRYSGRVATYESYEVETGNLCLGEWRGRTAFEQFPVLSRRSNSSTLTNVADLKSTGRLFEARGPTTDKACSSSLGRVHGMTRSPWSAERCDNRDGNEFHQIAEILWRMTDLDEVHQQYSLSSMRCLTGSQCSSRKAVDVSLAYTQATDLMRSRSHHSLHRM
jgi:hypothetical protein